jgi:hypothetical protein
LQRSVDDRRVADHERRNTVWQPDDARLVEQYVQCLRRWRSRCAQDTESEEHNGDFDR